MEREGGSQELATACKILLNSAQAACARQRCATLNGQREVQVPIIYALKYTVAPPTWELKQQKTGCYVCCEREVVPPLGTLLIFLTYSFLLLFLILFG